MSEPVPGSFQDAAVNHLRDALAMDVSQRWAWLREAMDYGFAMAQERARRGLVTLGPHGEVLLPTEARFGTSSQGEAS